MKIFTRALLALAVLVLCGCVTGRPYIFPSVKMSVVVVDSSTKKPIDGATLRLVARGNHTGREMIWDGFKTDSNGRCVIEVPSQTTWIGGSESFAGGFTRELEIKAPGYQTSYPIEELHYDSGRREYLYPFKDPATHTVELWPNKAQ